ncbi:hypothetical protein CLU83_1949 [Flavobacterium sp. 1]|uniref:hypothetical protein n=1 Tax=Flavobacterium sp. 1 TaxID=2035200 RepID=UPI000C23A2D1|nr:hypothetical protein [Flavobacterium sp. 1]PJJ08663.1 hypothetical protein CLU83_1949 [Flavobacterium sp. 1]
MSTDHNRIKVADLEINQSNRILTTNTFGKLEFSDINNIKTDSYNALDYSIAGKALDARQGKILKDLIDNINALLASDNVNLDTVQELVDAIETVQTSLNTILVNDVTTGGVTKALTAEMGKNLKDQIDALTTTVGGKQNSLTDVNFGAFESALPTVTAIADTDKISLLIGAVAKMMSWANFKTLFKTINGNSIFGSGNLITPDMDTTTAQNVSGIKTFLAGMFGLRNTANTFTSFFASAVTASRTWTWPDKSGTVAMTSDITNVINAGTTNYMPKYVGSTVVGNSRTQDTGTCFGIGTVNMPIKDITLGRQADRVIGIEQSDSLNNGRTLIIEAGKTINYSETTLFSSMGQFQLNWLSKLCASHPNGSIYLAIGASSIYKSDGTPTGAFLSTGSPAKSNWVGLTVAFNGDVYACHDGGDIYKQTGGTSFFVALSQTTRIWQGMASTSNGNIYAATMNGDIYMQTAGMGNFMPLGQSPRTWTGMCVNRSNNDVYAVVNGGDIYKQTGGVGNFMPLGQATRGWQGIDVSPNGDIWASVLNGDIYKQTAGVGSFNPTGQISRAWGGIAVNQTNGNVFVGLTGTGAGDVYYLNIQSLGTPDLDGGTLKLKAGTGKNLGKSRIQIITGQKSAVSGTDMQIETVRAEYYEDGNYKRIGTPVYADNTAAIAGGLTAGMEYRTNTGVKMEVY